MFHVKRAVEAWAREERGEAIGMTGITLAPGEAGVLKPAGGV